MSGENEVLGVLVVHGIGDQESGDSVRDFSATLRNEGLVQNLTPLEKVYLSEGTELEKYPQGLDRQFDTTWRSGELVRNSGKVVLAEVSWSDVSRLSSSWVGVALGLWNLLTGVRSLIAFALPRNNTLFSQIFFYIAQLSTLWITGPLLVLQLCAGYVFLSASIFGFGPRLSLIFTLPILLLQFGVWLVRSWQTGEPIRPSRENPDPVIDEWRSTRFWFLQNGLIQLGISIYFIIQLGGFRAPMISLEIGMTQFLAHYFVLLRLTFLILNILVFLVICLNFVGLAVGSYKWVKVPTLAVLIQYTVFAFVLPIIWNLITSQGDDSLHELLNLAFDIVVQDGVEELIAVVLIAILVTGLFLKRMRVLRLFKDDLSKWTRAESHRLILHKWIEWSLYIVFVVLTILAFLRYQNGLVVCSISPQLEKLFELFGIENICKLLEGRSIPRLYTFTVLALSALVFSRIRLVLDIANDVIHYIRYNSLPELKEGAYEEERGKLGPFFQVRNRFFAVYRYLKQKHGVTKWLIVSHSQGTIIVLDELIHRPELNAGTNISLLTFGSPINHLYQTYFEEAYPSWDKSHYAELKDNLKVWHNAFRIDDPVGTTVFSDDPKAKSRPVPDGWIDYPIGLGGHQHYWRDLALISYIKAQNLL